MSKAYRCISSKYIDSSSVVHNRNKLNSIIDNVDADIVYIKKHLQELVKIDYYSTTATTWYSGNRYKGNITLQVPAGYYVISIIPCYISYGDANFVTFNFYYEIPRIYYEVYCQYSEGKANCRIQFRVVMIKNNI